MMELYIANCSKQEFDFTYMLPENPRPFLHRIRAGSQVKIHGTNAEIDCIIKQHAIYGLMNADEVKKGFGGLAYRVGKPISIEGIEQGMSQADMEAIERALEARKVQAAASDMIIQQKAQEMGLRQTDGLEIEVLEEKRNAADTDSKFQQTIEVSRETAAPQKRGRGRPSKG